MTLPSFSEVGSRPGSWGDVLEAAGKVTPWDAAEREFSALRDRVEDVCWYARVIAEDEDMLLMASEIADELAMKMNECRNMKHAFSRWWSGRMENAEIKRKQGHAFDLEMDRRGVSLK